MNAEKYTKKTIETINTAQAMAQENGNQYLTSEHLLYALIDQDGGLIGTLLGRIGADCDAVLAEPFDLGVDRGGAHAARHEEVAPLAELVGLHLHEFRGVSQRACEIGEGIARIQRAYFASRGADGLRHDGDAALRGVEVRDRERDAFAVLVDADDDELPGLRRMCDARCEDLHQPDALGEESFFKYRVHL